MRRSSRRSRVATGLLVRQARGEAMHRSPPVSQEILSLGNIVAATIFPKEIVSL